MDDLFKRISHPVKEIRSRAFESLQFKVKTGIFRIGDLIHENQLIASLLNGMEEENERNSIEAIFYVLGEIVKHPSGAQSLSNYNGSERIKRMKPALANFTSTIVEDILKTLTTTAAVAAARSTGCYPSSRFSRHYYQQQREERLVDRTAAAQPYTSNAADNNRKFTSLVSSSVPPPPTTSNYSHPPLSRVGDNDASITHHSLHTHMRSSPELNRPASPFKPSVQSTVPPYIPNAVNSYEHLYLSPMDKELVDEFLESLKNPRVDHESEERLFDIICIDFGPQIFLQRSSIFRTLLHGLDSDNSDRLHQNLFYLGRLIVEWNKMFRRTADIFSCYSSATGAFNTPNVSMNAAAGPPVIPTSTNSVNRHSSSPSLLNSDYAISLPYACHDLFLKLVPMMRMPILVPLILRILYPAIPLVALHIDTIMCERSAFAEDQHLWSYFKSLANYYLSITIEVSGYYDSRQEESRQNGDGEWEIFSYTKNRVIAFALYFTQIVSTVCQNETTISAWTVIEQSCMMRSENFIPSFLFYSLFESGSESDSHILRIMTNYLVHPRTWVRKVIYSEILFNLRERIDLGHIGDDGGCEILLPKWITSSKFVHAVAQYGFDDSVPEINNISQEIIELMLNNSLMVSPQILLSPLQAVCHIKEGELLNLCTNVCSERLDRISWLLFWWKGLLHRSEWMRKRAFKELCSLMASFSQTDLEEPWNTLMFPTSFLCQNVQNGLAKIELSTKLNDIERLIANLSSAGSLEKKIGTLFDINRTITDPSVQRRAFQLNITSLLLKSFSVTDMDSRSGWLGQDDVIICYLNTLRILAEANSAACVQLSQKRDYLVNLLPLTFHRNITVKFALSKLLFTILFDMRGKCEEVTEAPPLDFVQYWKDMKNVTVPPFVESCYHMYGRTIPFDNRPNTPYSDLIGFAFAKDPNLLTKLLILSGRFDLGGASIYETICIVTEALKCSKSHVEFSQNLLRLKDIVVAPYEKQLISELDLAAIFRKFVLVMPASAEDMGILGEVLRLVVEFISCPQIFSQLKDLLLLALRSVLVPVLMICHENGLDYSQLRIADSVVLLICSLVKQISSEELVSLVSSSECLSALRNHLFLLFSKPEKNTLPKVRTLMSLLPIVSLPSLVATVSGESIAQMIDLYVQIIGQCQESFENFTSGDAFTYQDRCHYRWTALSLRNISRTAVVVHTAYKPWVWGSHWLFREDMDWLVQMLNDDEKILMKIGLGILGNLILIVGSYEYLCVKIPQFLDMAFSYALDFERGEMYRKESLLIINNFLMTFCHDNKLTSSQLLPTQDESVSEDTDNSISPANPKSSSDHDAINELLKIFEHCGFFDHLKDILDIKPTIIPYRCAVSALLLNMALIAPDCLRRKIHESQAWGLLISHMDGIDDISSSIVEMEEGGKAYSLLKGRQFHQIYNELGNQMEINTLHIIRLLEKDHEHTRLYLIQHTTIFQHLLQKIAYQFITLDQANGSTLASIGLCCRILSDLIWDFCQIDPAGLSKTFSVRENIVCLLECLEFLTSLTSDIELNSSGCVLLAKIASLHYGEVVNLGLDTYLIGPDQIVDGVDAGNDELGRKLVRNLVEILLNNYDSDDAMRMESVRISLQCFFGKCQFAKKEAIVENLPSKFVSRMNRMWLVTPGKLSETQQREVFVIITLIRHLMAGSLDVKLICAQQQIHDLLLDILSVKELNDPLLLETLCCLRNLVSNCEGNKKLILNHSKASRNKENTDFIFHFMRVLKGSLLKDDIFSAVLEILKLLCTCGDVWNATLKQPFCLEMKSILRSVVKNKDYFKVDQILQFFIRISASRDGQIMLVKLNGFITDLMDLLCIRSTYVRASSLILLRNLACIKESKAHFLVDEQYFQQMESLFASKSPRLFALVSSLIWVLLYDSEKAKVAFKKNNFRETINSFESRLASEYGCVCTSDGKITFFQEAAFPSEELKLLFETAHNVFMIKRLLNI